MTLPRRLYDIFCKLFRYFFLTQFLLLRNFLYNIVFTMANVSHLVTRGRHFQIFGYNVRAVGCIHLVWAKENSLQSRPVCCPDSVWLVIYKFYGWVVSNKMVCWFPGPVIQNCSKKKQTEELLGFQYKHGRLCQNKNSRRRRATSFQPKLHTFTRPRTAGTDLEEQHTHGDSWFPFLIKP